MDALEFEKMRRSNDKYGFGAMAIGDVSFISDPGADKVRSASSVFGRRHGMKFSCRRGVGGIYVARIA